MLDNEKRIQENRLIEATQKNLMGKAGKLACILKFLGHEIISESGKWFSATYMDDPWQLPDEQDGLDPTTIHDMDESADSHLVGYLFCGLSRGMHLEIKYMEDEKSYTVQYKGHPVYRESWGDLEAYAPFPEWEDKIESLYKVARKQADQYKQEVEAAEKPRIEREIQKKIDELRSRWGL